MMTDTLANWPLYTLGSPLLQRGFRFLAEELTADTPDGRIDLAGDDLYALVQTVETKPMGKCRFEAHNVYLDIQYVFKGAEIMGWTPRAELVVDDEYDPEKDVEFYEQPERFTPVEVPAGRFCIFLPGDGHEPLIRMGDDRHVRKVVIKACVAALYPARS